MKKVIGILYESAFNETSFETGCGGSETWVIQLAKEFARRNFHVIVFCYCEAWKIYDSLVEYVPLDLYQSRVQYQHFDYFIFTRLLDVTYDILVNNNDCENIYLQSHDMFIWENGMYKDTFDYDYNRFEKVKKFIALTEFHKKELIDYNNIPKNMISIIGNGLDSDIFDKVDNEYIEKDNEILWTSAFGRGGDILVNYILPIIKKEIPEFKVNICGYGDGVPDDIKNNPDVNFLGTLTKEEYYREFKKHKVWFLPCVVVEDFGICAAEAVMCGAHVISPYLHGMHDVLNAFTPFAMQHKYDIKESNNYHYSRYELDMNYEDFTNTNNEAAYSIINIIKNYNTPILKMLLNSQKNYVLEKYTWKKITDKWIELFNK